MNTLNRFILCIIDDVRAEHFFHLMEKGFLPNMKNLVNGGIWSDNCITDFPSITYPTHASILTGTYTGDYKHELCHGIPLLNWMGRDTTPPTIRNYASRDLQVYKLNDDLGKNCQTILEMLGEENTASFAQLINRGADYVFPESKLKLIYYYLILEHARNIKKMIVRANTMVITQLLKIFANPKSYFSTREPPVGSLIWFMMSDVLMHLYGFDSVLYKLNLMHIDRCIGYLVDQLKKLGYLDQTVIAITSDHGNYRTSHNGNLKLFNGKTGLKHHIIRKPCYGNTNINEFGGVGFFNFKSQKSGLTKFWLKPSVGELQHYGSRNIDVFDELFKIKGVKLMYYDFDSNSYKCGSIILKRKKEKTGKLLTSRIDYEYKNKQFKTKYNSEQEEDVFFYHTDQYASKLIDNRFHTIDEWLEATFHLNYPLYVDLIPRHFKNPRSSDVIISTQGTTAYNIQHGKKKNNNKYLHDIGLRASSVVPLVIGGADEVPSSHLKYCKITDIVPTLLKFIGKTPHKSVVGKCLL